MRRIVGILCVIGILLPVGNVWAQVGLYGSPEVLQLPAITPPATAPSPSPPVAPSSAPPTAAYRAPVTSYPAAWQPPVTAPVEYQPPNPAYGRQWLPTTNSVYGQPGAAMSAAGARPVVINSAGTPPAVASVPRVGPAPIPAVQPRNLTNQMLGERVPAGPVASADGGAETGESVCGGGLSGCGAGEPCAECAPVCETVPCCPWYGEILFLYMCRNQPDDLWTTYETDDEEQQIPTRINLTWAAGGQATVGYQFGCCCPWALEASYWGLSTIEGQVGVVHPNTVSTSLDVSWINFGDPALPATDYFDHAAEHLLTRQDQVHSAEIGLVHRPFGCGAGACNPYDLRWGLGFRYFRFEEDWSFGSLADGYEWGEDGGIHEAYLQDQITNDLFGFQLGCDLNYRWRPTLSLFVAPSVGIYNNQIHHEFAAIRGDGTVADLDPASGFSDAFPVVSTKNALAFLTQIDVGLDWRFSERWSARVGYRAVVATGIGLADNQIPHYVFDVPVIRAIDYNGELVLHGGFAGLTFNY